MSFALLGLALFTTSCGPSAKRGTVIGGLAGAGTGAIVGNQSGRGLEGAAIGGLIGAGAGALWGSARDDERERYYHEKHKHDRYYDDRHYDRRRY